MKRWFPILVSAAMLACGIAEAQTGDAVKPLELLQRAVDAHAKMGPVTMKCVTTLGVGDGVLNRDILQTIQTNDPDHSVIRTKIMVGRYTDSEYLEYIDGDVRVTYNTKDKEYGRSPDNHDVYRECLQAVRSGLLYPEQSKKWAKARVKAEKVDGAPVHTVQVKDLGIHHRGHADPEAVKLSIDDATGLVRVYRVGFKDDIWMSMTVQYTQEPAAFPESTFVFTPPAGAKESKPEKMKMK